MYVKPCKADVPSCPINKSAQIPWNEIKNLHVKPCKRLIFQVILQRIPYTSHILQGLLDVPIKHHPTIGDIISNR